MGLSQNDVLRRRTQQLQTQFVDAQTQRLTRPAFSLARFGNHDEAFGLRHGIAAAEHRHASLANAR